MITRYYKQTIQDRIHDINKLNDMEATGLIVYQYVYGYNHTMTNKELCIYNGLILVPCVRFNIDYCLIVIKNLEEKIMNFNQYLSFGMDTVHPFGNKGMNGLHVSHIRNLIKDRDSIFFIEKQEG